MLSAELDENQSVCESIQDRLSKALTKNKNNEMILGYTFKDDKPKVGKVYKRHFTMYYNL